MKTTYPAVATSVILACCFLLFFPVATKAQEAVPGQPLPAWRPGYLDLHHINTGRGNAAFFVFPDGTNLLVDAGELDPTEPRTTSARNAPIRPDASKQPFEWIVDYIRQFSPDKEKTELDYALITHFHDDHFGGWYPQAPASRDGSFKRSGITGVGDLLPVHRLLTRNPDYPVPVETRLKALPAGSSYSRSWTNYKAFVQSLTARGMRSEYFKAGSASQVRLVHEPASYPGFQIRNLKSDDAVWTGRDSTAARHFAPANGADPKTWPDENSLSNALLLSYGPFKYYTGGDNPGNIFFGDSSWRDTESLMAGVIGRVDVATMDHHGNRDAVNETLVKTMQPRVWIEQVWTADHPGHEVLIRVMSKLYAGPRDLFATNMLEANRLVIGPLIDQSYKSQQGHILVRVLPGGQSYYIIILDDARTDRKVKAVFGPYTSAGRKNP
ncbi:MAG: hypothetical protein INR73_01120 [Williamsia sp.]|nr:hypothetical protein [Williamsia sp.]